MPWTPLAEWLHSEIGYVVDHSKHYLLESACRDVMNDWRCTHPSQLVHLVRSDAERRQQVINACTINESSFFRDAGLWTALREQVLPELAQRAQHRGRVHVLQCATANGQELCTLAMCWNEAVLPPGVQLALTATDIDTQVLARAQQAEYSDFEVSRGLDAVRRERHFMRTAQGWRLKPERFHGVTFQQLNLNTAFTFPIHFDLILCRNVLIYFDPAGKRRVLDRLGQHLADKGYLVLGGAETTFGISDDWNPKRIGDGTVYQRHDHVLGSPSCR